MAERLARRIERHIEEIGWPVGEVIGSEASLLERYQVSRAVLREAIRLLEHHGVAVMRRGPGGGLMVTAPDARAATASTALYLRYAQVTPQQLWEVRRVVEVATTRLAAERLDEAGMDKLQATLEAERARLDGDLVGVINDFHVVVAGLCGNPALALFTAVLATLSFDKGNREMFEGDAERRPGHEAHQAHCSIAEALIAGDIPRAVRRMEKHLEFVPDFTK